MTPLCALASRRFRSTLTRLAEWCNAIGKERGKNGRRQGGMETTASRSCRTRNLRERRAAALADLTALTGTEGLTGQTESLAREGRN